MRGKYLFLSALFLIICPHSLFPQDKSVEFSFVHNGIGNNLSFEYKINKKRLTCMVGMKYHLNRYPGDKKGILGNGRAYNFFQHFGTTMGVSYDVWEANNRVSFNAFYHNQVSVLGYMYYEFVPVGYFYDPVVNKNVLAYSYELQKFDPVLIIEQNMGIGAKLVITKQIKVTESIGSGLMLYFNQNKTNQKGVGEPNLEFIVPFFKIGVEYTFKK